MEENTQKDVIQLLRTSLDAANERIKELEEENFNIREAVLLRRIAIPEKLTKDKNFVDLYELPSYEQLYDKNAAIRAYVVAKLNKANDCIVESLTQLEQGEKAAAALKLSRYLTIQECLDNILIKIDETTGEEDILCKEEETSSLER